MTTGSPLDPFPDLPGAPPPAAVAMFGSRLALTEQYADQLAGAGVRHGLLGPREVSRLWTRHLLNCAALTDLVPQAARVVDVGSGAGLPGIPMALRRPDLRVDLVEPMLRRSVFLTETVQRLQIANVVRVCRGRAEDRPIVEQVGGADWVVARAVAPLDRLMKWCLPLLAPGGRVLAVKGAQAATEISAHRSAILRFGAGDIELQQLPTGELDEPTWVIVVQRPCDRPAAGREGAGMTETDGAFRPVPRETPPDRPPPAAPDFVVPTVSHETRSDATEGELPPLPDVPRETAFDTPIAREAAQAVHVQNVRQERWPRPKSTRILTVANQKGGVGKTTSAVNLAAAMALHGLRVLLIDLDPQGNASTALGIHHGVGTPSVYDVLLGGRPFAEVVQPTEFAPSLQCVPATLDLAGADIELASQVAREYRLQRALDTYMSSGVQFDYVLIDCPPSLGLLTLNALVAAREVLIPIQCEYYALEGLAQLLNTVDLVTSHLNPKLIVSTVLLTMYDSRTRLADQVADEVRRHFGELVLAPVIPRNVRVSEAPGYGQTVMTYDAGSRGAIGYLQAAREMAERGTQGTIATGSTE